MRYTTFLEKNSGPEQARAVFERVTSTFHKRRPEVHLEYAAFEEQQQNYDKCREIYKRVTQHIGALLTLCVVAIQH